jgi:hypothetical protein
MVKTKFTTPDVRAMVSMGWKSLYLFLKIASNKAKYHIATHFYLWEEFR